MIGKKKADVTLTRINSQPITAKYDDLEYFAGRKVEKDIYQSEGCVLNADVVLARFYPTDSFRVFVKIGDYWRETLTVSPSDPAIMELQESGQMIDCGESPQDKAKRETKEKEAQEKLEEEAAMKRAAAERIRKIKELEAQRQQQARHEY